MFIQKKNCLNMLEKWTSFMTVDAAQKLLNNMSSIDIDNQSTTTN